MLPGPAVLAPEDELPAGLAVDEAAAHTPVPVYVDGHAEALIEVGDVVRPGSHRAVDRLRRLGVRLILATGDRNIPAQAVAKALGIEEAHARCTPEDKAPLVRDLQEQGRRVAVIGDGVKAAAALAGADLGIAMGTGTDVAMGPPTSPSYAETSRHWRTRVCLARRTLGKIRASLVWTLATT